MDRVAALSLSEQLQLHEAVEEYLLAGGFPAAEISSNERLSRAREAIEALRRIQRSVGRRWPPLLFAATTRGARTS